QAAVHGQDVLGGEPARLAISSSADRQLVVDALNLEWVQGLEELGAEVGAHVVVEQGAVAGDGSGPKGGLDVGQPAVQVLVDGEFGRVEGEAVAAAGLGAGPGRLGFRPGGGGGRGRGEGD